MKTIKFSCETSGISGSVEVLESGRIRIEYYFWGSSNPNEFEGSLEDMIKKIPPSSREKILSKIAV